MAKTKKIEEGELAQLKALNIRMTNMRDQIAEAVLKQQVLSSQYPTAETEFINYQNEIQQKYGNIRLNIATGEYTLNDEKED